jgi:hypothetical protein
VDDRTAVAAPDVAHDRTPIDGAQRTLHSRPVRAGPADGRGSDLGRNSCLVTAVTASR